MLGYISYKFLPLELFPEMNYPVIYINVSSSTEVDPKYMETQAVVPLEEVVGSLEGVEEIESEAGTRRGSIMITLNSNVNDKFSYLKLEEKINAIKSTLPDNFVVSVNKFNLSQAFTNFMELQVRGSGGINRVRNFVDTKVLSEIQNISGVASVNVFGGQEKTLQVIINKGQCEAHGITVSQIQGAITSNGVSRAFAGKLVDGSNNFLVHVSAEYDDITDIENIVIPGSNFRLKDLAEISFGVKEQESYSRVNGKDIVTLSVINDSQENTIDLSHRVRKHIEELNKKYKESDIELVVQSDSAEKMENNINEIMNLALIGCLLAVLILWYFLRNIRLVSVIAISVPISVLTAFNFFYYYGITVNTLTLIGIALAVGMLLDNSIVVLENIYSHYSRGKSPAQAVVAATKEVSRSIIAATLTTVTVFLPFVFSDNLVIGFIGKNIGVSIISTLLVSLVVAFLLIPTITYLLINRKNKRLKLNISKLNHHSRIIQVYIVFLKTCLRNPATTIITAILIFFISLASTLLFSTETLKEVESNQFKMYVTMPSGSTLENTEKVVEEIEEKLSDLNEKKDVIANIREDVAVLTLVMKEDFEDIADRDIFDIKDDVEGRFKRYKSAEVELSEPENNSSFGGGRGGGGGGGMMPGGTGKMMKFLGVGSSEEKILIKGNDFEQMTSVANELKFYIEEQDYIRTARININENKPEVHLNFDTRIMTEMGIKTNNVLSELRTFKNEFTTGAKFKQGVDEYSIIVKEDDSQVEEEEEVKHMTMNDLKTLQVETSGKSTIDLQHISNIYYSRGLASIKRVNQSKEITLKYRFTKDAKDSKELLESYRTEIDDIISSYNLPSGIALEVIHEENDMDDFYFLITAAIILILMILASVFESVSTPFVLLLSVPLAAIGSFLALLFSGNSIFNNTNSLMGMLILLGIVVNNGIILIDFVSILRRDGYTKQRAIITAGISRIRPISITAITTIVAMLPLAMGDSEYVGVIGAPFAITVIGGLVVSTILTLVFIPTFYSGLENTIKWFNSLKPHIIAIQAVIFTASVWMIYTYVDSSVWKYFDIFLLVITIPGITYFTLTSLRKSNADIIGKDESLIIEIQNIVKIYGRPSRFKREWRGGINLVNRLYPLISKPDIHTLFWEVPLLSFASWFAFSYLKSGFWILVMVISLYFAYTGILNQISKIVTRKFFIKIFSKLAGFNKWFYPLIICVYLSKEWGSLPGAITITTIWYLFIIINESSKKLLRDKINVERLKGRFRSIRRAWYLMVVKIPVIGKRVQPFKALKGVSFNIETGMFGLLGPNGAGKSTLMRIICGIFEQSYGKIWINGIDTQEKREELQGLIGYLPQEFGMYENMSAWEYLDYQAILKGLTEKATREERLKYVLEAVHMYERCHEKIGSFSGGMKQRIGIAQILLHLPKILVVDEPTAGLDPRERIRFRNLLVELSKNRIVIFSTHIIEDISSSCNRVAVINKGELKYLGNPTEMNKLAKNFAWQLELNIEDFEAFNANNLVVHHMRVGDIIKIRCLSETKPSENAIQVEPTLEEAYLCLLRGMKQNNDVPSKDMACHVSD